MAFLGGTPLLPSTHLYAPLRTSTHLYAPLHTSTHRYVHTHTHESTQSIYRYTRLYTDPVHLYTTLPILILVPEHIEQTNI